MQCEIIKTKHEVLLKDRSSTGTCWVNGHKVGKDRTYPLENDSEISFAAANKKVLVFMSTEKGQDQQFPATLTDKYVVSKVLGRGITGEVRLGFRVSDMHRVAIKIIRKGSISKMTQKQSNQVLNEVKILQSVSHPCVINLEDVIDTSEYLFIVLELAEGGELFDKIIEKTKMNESEAKEYFFQIASAIQYLHSKRICHRDLKPENILLCTLDDSNPVVKITDMGLSKLVSLGTELKTFCGTPHYIAPEIVKNVAVFHNDAYTVKVDCWSLGVILYILLSGTPPFSAERNCGMDLKNQILKANYNFYPQLFNNISDEAKDLIQKLLKVSPDERLSAQEILEHPWLHDPIVESVKALMNSRQRGKKRLVHETENEVGTSQRKFKSLQSFPTPDAGIGMDP